MQIWRPSNNGYPNMHRLNNRDIKKEKMNKAKPQLTEMSTCEQTL